MARARKDAPLDAAQRARLVRAYVAGAGVGALAGRFGVSDKTVQRILMDAGVELRRGGMRVVTDEEIEEAVARGIDQGFGYTAIASNIGAGYERVKPVYDRLMAERREAWPELTETELELAYEAEAEAYRAAAEGQAFDAFMESRWEDE